MKNTLFQLIKLVLGVGFIYNIFIGNIQNAILIGICIILMKENKI